MAFVSKNFESCSMFEKFYGSQEFQKCQRDKKDSREFKSEISRSTILQTKC